MTDDQAGTPRAGAAMAATARKLDRDPRLLTLLQRARRLLPGDERFGDPLSMAGTQQRHAVGRRLAEITAERPGVLREVGFSALQVWQALSEAQGRGHGDAELAIVFTDLVEFSTWAVEAGNDQVLELIRDVAEAIEPPVSDRRGRVVKRLGDGMMAVFSDPSDALDAIFEARERLAAVQVPGYEPHIRAGMHFGSPRRISGDYLGVDVNIAARVAGEAGADELLVSDRALARLDQEVLSVRRKRLFRVKGVPKDVTVYSVAPVS
jgi:class 3 adenylate cyclase